MKFWTLESLLCFMLFFSSCSAEIDQKLQEIMKQTGYLKIDGQVMKDDLQMLCVFVVSNLSSRMHSPVCCPLVVKQPETKCLTLV